MNEPDIPYIPDPDPAWDYYIVWHSLHHIKAKIDAALKIIGKSEDAKPEIDALIKNLLVPTSLRFLEIVEQFPTLDDDD